jgi:transcriptional regulator with XRE-family HTH domain
MSPEVILLIEQMKPYVLNKGVSATAKEAGVSRATVYRMLNHQGNPRFKTFCKIMDAVGLRMTVTKTFRSDEYRPKHPLEDLPPIILAAEHVDAR